MPYMRNSDVRQIKSNKTRDAEAVYRQVPKRVGVDLEEKIQTPAEKGERAKHNKLEDEVEDCLDSFKQKKTSGGVTGGNKKSKVEEGMATL